MSPAAPLDTLSGPKMISSAARPAHRHGQLGQQLGLAFRVAVALRQAHHQTQRSPARNDRRLVDRIAFRLMHGAQRMAALVVGGHPLLGLGHHERTSLSAHHHLVLGCLEFRHRDHALAHARRQQRCLVHEVRQIGAGEAGRAACDHLRVDVRRQRHLAHVNPEDLFAAVNVRIWHHHLPVEAPGA